MEQVTLSIKQEATLMTQMQQLPKNDLVRLVKCASKTRRIKYDDSHKYHYGNLPRCFNKQQLTLFFKKVFRNQTRRIFLIQFFYALRIGELYDLEYLPQQKLLKVHNHKCDRIDYLPIHSKTAKLFITPLHLPHIDNLRKSFRNAIKKAGLEYTYYDEGRFKLHQFTPHSLRHTAITTFMEQTNNPLKATHYSRHKTRAYGSLPTYYYYSMEDMRKDLEKAFKKYYHLIP